MRGLAQGIEAFYPGHGEPGGRDLLDWEADYLAKYRAEITSLAQGRSGLTESEKATLVARMKEHLPTDKLEFLISLGADAVAAELARLPATGGPPSGRN